MFLDAFFFFFFYVNPNSGQPFPFPPLTLFSRCDSYFCMGPDVRNGQFLFPQSGASNILYSPVVYYPMRGFVFTYSQPFSCQDIYQMNPSSRGVSGPYTVASGQVYCDMSTDSDVPGWTLVMMLASSTSDSTFDYNSAYWTNSDTLNPNVATISQNVNMKNSLFNTLPVTMMRFVIGDPSPVNPGFNIPIIASSAAAIFSGGFVGTGFSRSQFNSVITNLFGGSTTNTYNQVFHLYCLCLAQNIDIFEPYICLPSPPFPSPVSEPPLHPFVSFSFYN